ncbi:MAG: hypothetical protein KBC81_02070 [Candidatus Pacebacteria bacterium]|nr:hypothetical protein [Candidatus Paceibacterota bacterium]
MENNKKQLITLIVVASSLTSFLAGYLLTRPSNEISDAIQQQRGVLIDRFSDMDTNSTPTPLPPGLLQASTDTALAPTNAHDSNSVIYYHTVNGHVSKIDLETRNSTLISTTQLNNLSRVIWSSDKNRVVTVSRNSSSPAYKYFDYTSKANGSLGINIKDAVFSPDSQNIAIVRSAGGDSTIEIIGFGASYPKTILKTRLNNISLFWPSSSTLAFSANDDGADTQSLYLLNENGELTQLIDGERALSIVWSSDGSRFIYSGRDGDTTTLKLFDITSQKSSILPVASTAQNCAWTMDQKSILCAIEFQGETSATKINLSNNSTQTLFSNLIITPKQVFLSNLEDFLVIISAADQSIWELKL